VKAKDWFIFVLLGGIWSSSFLWIKIAVQEVGPITLVAFRVAFGLLFSVAMILITRTQLPRTSRVWLPLLMLGVSNVAIPFFLISWGERTIDSAVAAILDATVPLFAIVIAHLSLHDDRITLPKALGLLLGFTGVLVLLSEDVGASPGSLMGQAAVIIASIFYAGSSVFARKYTEEAPGIIRSMGPLLSSTMVMWPAAALVERPLMIPRLPITWIALAWLGILGSGFAFVLSYYLIHAIGPTRTTMVTYLFPLGGLALGMIFLGEVLTWERAVGAALIVVSLAVANWQPRTRSIKDVTLADGLTDE
jgi:drug/metabolite transporter (DMT)-like permease